MFKLHDNSFYILENCFIHLGDYVKHKCKYCDRELGADAPNDTTCWICFNKQSEETEDINQDVPLYKFDKKSSSRFEDSINKIIDPNEDDKIRGHLIYALGNLGDPRAIEPLIEVLDEEDNSRYLIKITVDALCNFGDPHAIKPLIKLLKKYDDNEIRTYAADGLVRLGDQAIEQLIESLDEYEFYNEDYLDFDEDLEYVNRKDFILYIVDILGKLSDPRALEPLIELLSEDDHDIRKSAAFALENIGDPRAFEPFVTALKKDSYNLMSHAPYSLLKIDESRAIEPLIKILRYGDSDSKVSAADALGKLGDPRAIEPLVIALKENNSTLRLFASEAIVEIGDPSAIKHLFKLLKYGNCDVKKSAADILCKLDDSSLIGLLIELLNDHEEERRISGAYALSKMGPNAFWPLVGALNDTNEKIRMYAVVGLGNIGESRVLEYIIGALNDDSDEIKLKTIQIIGKIGDERTLKPLLELLNNSDEYKIRSAAATATTEIGKKICEENPDNSKYFQIEFTNLIKNADLNELDRSMALITLGDETAIEYLINYLYTSNTNNEIILEALDKTKFNPSLLDNGAYYWICKGYWDKAIEMGKMDGKGDQTISILINCLDHPKKDIQESSIIGLMGIGEAAIKNLLIELFKPDINTKKEILEILDEINWNPKNYENGICYWINKREWDNVVEGYETWDEKRLKRNLSILSEFLESHDENIRLSALESLIEIKEVSSLVNCLESHDENIRLSALESLIEIKEVSSLVNCLESHDENIRLSALESLIEIKEELTINDPLRVIESDSNYARWASATILGQMGDSNVNELLINLLMDPDKNVRNAAAFALNNIESDFENRTNSYPKFN